MNYVHIAQPSSTGRLSAYSSQQPALGGAGGHVGTGGGHGAGQIGGTTGNVRSVPASAAGAVSAAIAIPLLVVGHIIRRDERRNKSRPGDNRLALSHPKEEPRSQTAWHPAKHGDMFR